MCCGVAQAVLWLHLNRWEVCDTLVSQSNVKIKIRGHLLYCRWHIIDWVNDHSATSIRFILET